MRKKIVFINIVFILIFYANGFSQIEKYNFNNWPGKNTVAKKNIEIDHNFTSNHKLSLAKGFSDSIVFYKVPLSEDDSLKKGRLQLSIYSSSKEAQLALVEYLDCLTLPVKPNQLKNEHFKQGDIAFGKEHDGKMQMAFTRNNVLVVLHAPTDTAMSLAKELDIKIKNAPEWGKNDKKPSIKFAE